MATLKHISSKNADYGAAERYLTFEHDEFSGKAVRDKHGHLVPREEYRMDTLLCGEEDFAIACMKANLRHGKNNLRADVKSHHYIISYDPRDAEDHGLTIDRAQKLGVEFCRQHFPGHQAMIVTHPDGHNHSGNIHTHIVINSLRIEDVLLMPYMDRACETKAGMKHRCTAAFFRYLRAEVMEMCHHHGLHQIDLLSGSRNRITEKEYWVQRRAQGKQESSTEEPGSISEPDSVIPAAENLSSSAVPTRFETDKEKLRQTLRSVLSEAMTMEEFMNQLLQFGITVKESRGRYSYLTSERTKPITSRKLGDDFSREAVMEKLKANAEKRIVKPSVPGNTIYEKHGFRSKEELEAVYSEAYDKAYDLAHRINALEEQIGEKKNFRQHLQNYRAYRGIYNEWKGIRREKKRNACYGEHQKEIDCTESAIRYFKAHGLTRLPAVKKLQEEIENMIRQSNALHLKYEEAKTRADELLAVKMSVGQLSRYDNGQRHEQQRRQMPDHEH